MKKYYLLIAILVAVTTQAQTWTVFDGSTTPDAADPSWDTGDAGVLPTYSIGTEGENSFLSCVTTASDDKGSFKLKTGQPTNTTVMFRTRATGTLEEGQPDASMEHEVIATDGTSSYRINFKLKKHTKGGYVSTNYFSSDDPIYPSDSTMNVLEWQTIRITIANGNEFNVYINESQSPIFTSTSSETTTNSQYIRIGDIGGTYTQGDIDWIAWDNTGDYAPGTGTLPEGVIVDGASTSINQNLIHSEVISVNYYNLSGTFVSSLLNDLSNGFYIKKSTLKNGSIITEKIVIKQ